MPKLRDPRWADLQDASPEPGEPRRGRPSDLASLVRDQLRCLASVDEGVARILDVLQQKNVLDNTVVIFTSDHGFLHGEFGIYKDKRWPYDPCQRIPFLLRYPPVVKPGMRTESLGINLDVAPTLLELAQVKWFSPLQGRSLVPILHDPQAKVRDAFLFEYFVEKVTPLCPRYFGVRTNDWKYIHFPQLEGMDELYHVGADPKERSNLIDDPQAQEKLAGLRKELSRLSRESANPFSLSYPTGESAR
jgi:arylsulfatase A-like enzyme